VKKRNQKPPIRQKSCRGRLLRLLDACRKLVESDVLCDRNDTRLTTEAAERRRYRGPSSNRMETALAICPRRYRFRNKKQR
jgi:hypothetical protein